MSVESQGRTIYHVPLSTVFIRPFVYKIGYISCVYAEVFACILSPLSLSQAQGLKIYAGHLEASIVEKVLTHRHVTGRKFGVIEGNDLQGMPHAQDSS